VTPVDAAAVRAALEAAGLGAEATPTSPGVAVSEGPQHVAIVVHGPLTEARQGALAVCDALADAGLSSRAEGCLVLVPKFRLPRPSRQG
jgi:hypothetical protein